MRNIIDDNTLKLVKNENTPASILEEIAENLEKIISDAPHMFFSDQVEKINLAIIQNPNVSPKTIVNLTSKYTMGYTGKYVMGLTYLLDNPAIDLILLSDPDIIEKIYLKYKKQKRSLERYVEVFDIRFPCFHIPPQFSSLAANSKCVDLRELVACGEKTPIRVLEKLSNDREDSVRGLVAINPNTPLSLLEKLADDRSDKVKIMLAKNKNISELLSRKMSHNTSVLVRKQISLIYKNFEKNK